MYINTQTASYPISEQDIRLTYPNTSFSVPFQVPEDYAWVFPTPQPEYTNLQMAREIVPVLTDKGHYEQQREVVEKFSTQEEIDAYLKAERKASVPASVSVGKLKK